MITKIWMVKIGKAFTVLTAFGLLAWLAPPVQAGFRSPESLVRNVYAYYGDRSSELSSGLPRDEATARQFFDTPLLGKWLASKSQPYYFFVQSKTWKLGGISISILRRQFDKTYVAAAFDNQGRKVTMNFILIEGLDGWGISDVERP